jgi:hypothetical protein
MSKKIFELFGKPLSDQSQQATALRKTAECPYTNAACDGGGNRHQTTISLGREALVLQEFFAGLETVIPGVCSIQSDDETWLVCPRRLFGVKESTQSLLPHELAALQNMDLPQGVELGIWAEVTLNVRDEDSSFNYHFDYLIAPVTRVPIDSVSLLIADPKFIRELRKQNPSGQIELPDLTQFAIVEVMTASTSCSNTKKGTDISTAFKRAVLGENHESPGINKRQVWGRMATQLFAKSACARLWGGKTFWLLQDQFLTEIEKTTKLSSESIDRIGATSPDSVNLMVFNVDTQSGSTVYSRTVTGQAGLPFDEENQTYTGILLPKKVPERVELLKAVLRKPVLLRVVL